MTRPLLEVADIVRAQGNRFIENNCRWIHWTHRKVLPAIARCRTAALGGHHDKCPRCGYRAISFNSCRNRHCPKCQCGARDKWIAARQNELLAVAYVHVVFTLPHQLSPLALQNKKVLYDLLFRASAETLLQVAADPKHLGAQIGFLSVLHTWGQNLRHHPHLHCVVPGGGLSPDHQRWISCRPGFFLPVRVLSRLFRRLFLEALAQAFQQGKLQFFGELEALRDASSFTHYLAPLRQTEWVVYAKPPFGGPAQVLAYLGRYTHRVAISNRRLLAAENGNITFQWKDYRHHGREKSRVMTLAADELMRRFLLHTLPPGFPRIRYFGFLANRHRSQKLALCRQLLIPPITELLPQPAACRELSRLLEDPAPLRCPSCGQGFLLRLRSLPVYRWPAQPPDTS